MHPSIWTPAGRYMTGAGDVLSWPQRQHEDVSSRHKSVLEQENKTKVRVPEGKMKVQQLESGKAD